MISAYDEIWDCFQAVIARECEINGIDNEFLLTMSVGIRFSEKINLPFYRKLKPAYNYSLETLFEDILGWEIIFQEMDSRMIMLDTIEKALRDNHKVLLAVDTMYCPWNMAYRVRGGIHYCNLVQIIKNERKILLLDPYSGKQPFVLSFCDFEKAKKMLLIIKTRCCIKPISADDILNIVADNLKKRRKNHVYEFIIEAFKNVTDFNDLFESEKIEACRLIVNSRQICNHFKGFCNYLEKNNFSDTSIYDYAYCAQKEWNVISMIFIRMHVSHEISKNNYEKIILKFEKLNELDKLIKL